MPVRQRPKFNSKDGTPFEIIINDFRGGTKTLLDEGRLLQNSVFISQNMMLDQDGVWRVRDGTQNYGATLTTPIDGVGKATVYNSDGTNTNYLFVLDNGTLKYSKDGGAWTSMSGKTWTTNKPAQILQVYSRLYVTNGVDNLAYADLTNLASAIITYTALSTPVAPTLGGRNTLTTGSYNQYYKVTAVNKNIGETAASPELTFTTNKQRQNWLNNSTTQESVDLTCTAVTNADSYNWYWSDITGQEVYIGSSSTTSFRDTGQSIPNFFQAAPATDGTAGPKASQISFIGNRIWLTNDPSFPYRSYWSAANPQNVGSFNPFYGGGYIDLNLGSDEKAVRIESYRTGKGDASPVVLTSSPTAGGQAWFLALTSIAVGSVSVIVPTAFSQGSIGTNSPKGVVQAYNNIYYPSVKGFQSLGSTQNILNVLVTSEISTAIRPSVNTINSAQANLICGIYYYGRIYWSVPVNSSTVNNQIWLLDLERQTWTLPWTFGVKQFIEYTSSDGVIHLLAVPVTGTKLLEINKNFLGDNNVSFPTTLRSGLIFWSKNHFSWAWINKVYVELGRPKGNITFNVYGTAPNKNLSVLKSISFTDSSSSSGWGSDLWGGFLWGDSGNVPSVYTQSSTKKVLYVNKPLNNLEWELTSSDVNAQYSLLEIGITGYILPSTDPSSWRR